MGDRAAAPALRKTVIRWQLRSWFTPLPSRPKPSTSWKHDLPKFCRRQWRAFARRLRRSKTIDGGKTSEKRGFHAVDGALCRAGAGRATLLGRGIRQGAAYAASTRACCDGELESHPSSLRATATQSNSATAAIPKSGLRRFARNDDCARRQRARRPLICRLRRHLLPRAGRRGPLTPSSAAARCGCARGRRRRRAACGIRRASRGSRRSPGPSARRCRPAPPRKAAGSPRSFPAPRR